MQRVRKQLGCSDRIQNEAGNTGVTVAVLDTGISQHPDFGNRIIAFHDFVGGKRELYDDSGHGTHVAGCIGGSGAVSGGLYKGIAPDCLFCVGKVLNHEGEGTIEAMYNALLWILDHRIRYRIRVLNVSVGINQSRNQSTMAELIELLNAVWDSGIVVVCAAGNNGPEEGTISPLGSSAKVITVGCHEGGYFGVRKDLCENYSGRGGGEIPYRKPDLVAPGTDIISCSVNCRRNAMGRYYNAYAKKSGTSMATPIVSGAAALLLQKYPYMNNLQVKRKMVYSARNMQEAWNKQGWGMLDIENLFRSC